MVGCGYMVYIAVKACSRPILFERKIVLINSIKVFSFG